MLRLHAHYVSCYCIQMLFVTSDGMRSEMKLEFAELTLSYLAVLSCYSTECYERVLISP